MSYEYGGAPEADFAVYVKVAASPLGFGTAIGHPVDDHGSVPTGSPYVVWADDALVVSAGSGPLPFVSHDFGAAGSWTTAPSATPAGYTRALVPLVDGIQLLGISAGAIGASGNVVTVGIDRLPLR
jgi:hypothetical protein